MSLCVQCSEATATHTCGHCHVARYCSRACQCAHWPQHRERCAALQRAPSGTETSVTYLRRDMAASYYSGASDAYRYARTLRFGDNTRVADTLQSLIDSRLELAASLGNASAERMMVDSDAERQRIWSEMAAAAYAASDQLESVSAANVDELDLDPALVAAMRASIAQDVPIGWNVGYADAMFEIVHTLTSMLASNASARGELIQAVQVCMAAFMITRERAVAKTRERRAQNAAGEPTAASAAQPAAAMA